MTRRLVVDDERTFRFDAKQARTSRAGLRALRGFFGLFPQEYDEIWLDYDLGGEDTIMPVVDELVHRAWTSGETYIMRPDIIIHTENPVGRKRIEAALGRYYKIAHADPAQYFRS